MTDLDRESPATEIRLPDATHERGVGFDEVVEELATRTLNEHDLEAHFRACAARGD